MNELSTDCTVLIWVGLELAKWNDLIDKYINWNERRPVAKDTHCMEYERVTGLSSFLFRFHSQYTPPIKRPTNKIKSIVPKNDSSCDSIGTSVDSVMAARQWRVTRREKKNKNL